MRNSGTRKTSVGVIGAGTVAQDVHLPVLRALKPSVDVVYVADSSEANLKKASGAFRCPGVLLGSDGLQLPESDVVLITAPVGVRDRYYDYFADRGIAVYAEKPIALSTDRLDELQAMFGLEDFCVGFQRRTYAGAHTMRRVIPSGVFGRLIRIEVSEGARTTKSSSQAFLENLSLSGGGILMDLGCHGIDLAFNLTQQQGARLDSVDAWLDDGLDRQVRLRADLVGSGPDVELVSDISWIAERAGQVSFTFDQAVVRMSTSPSGDVEIVSREGEPMGTLGGAGESRVARTIYQACYLVWDSFLSARQGRVEPEFTLESARPGIDLIASAYEQVRATQS